MIARETTAQKRRIGTYEIRSLLGIGGIGEVYTAFDPELQRNVAIKTLRPEFSRDRTFLERFRAEAKSLGRLNHPNIATLHSLIKDGGTICMVMELVQGCTLENILTRKRRLEVSDSLAIMAQAIAGLRYAHQMGVIHRDIKPSNLMITDEGVLKLMDFGIARVHGSQRLTKHGDIVGTLAYAAPEQVRGHEGDRRSDLYSLAMVLYEMLAGRLPFEANSDYELMRQQVEGAPPEISYFRPDIGPTVSGALMRALSKEPGKRFSSVEEFGRALGTGSIHGEPAELIRQHLLKSSGATAFARAEAIAHDLQSVPTPEVLQPNVQHAARSPEYGITGRLRLVAAATFARIPWRSAAPRNGQGHQWLMSRKALAAASSIVALASIGYLAFGLVRTHEPTAPRFVQKPEPPAHIVVSPAPGERIVPLEPPPVPSAPPQPSTTPAPTNQPQRETPSLAGEVIDVLDSSALIVSGKIVNLYGIRGEDGAPAQALKRYLSSIGGHVSCYARAGDTYQCLADGQDVAEKALRNGWARARGHAPQAYSDAEKEARRARRGVWSS
jgi:serine/threonine-protein kinase